VPQNKRLFEVINDGTFDLSVTRGSTTLEVLEANSATFYQDGTTNGLYKVGGEVLTTEAFGLIEGLRDFIDTPAAKTYVLDQSALYDYQINSAAYQMSAGTCTIAIQINGVNVTGLSALAADNTAKSTNATALRTVAPGDRVTAVVSAPAGAANLGITVVTERIAA
jgi:hypothetical protein